MSDVSIVDLLRQDFDELSQNVDVTIPVVGYDKSGLAIKYRLPESGKELDDLQRKVEKANKDRWYRALWNATDTMILLCEGFYVKPEDVDEYVMLDPEETGLPIRFDARLAKLVGLAEEARARDIVRKLFDGNDMMLMSHFEKLARWINNTKADLTVEFWQVGEAS